MNFLQTILVFSLCIASVYVLPATLANESLSEDDLYSMVLKEIRSAALIDTHAMTLGEVACADDYNKATAIVNNRLLNQTNACFENANKTSNTVNVNVNKTVTAARTNMLNAQKQITNCTALTDNNQFINCTIATFDYTLAQLNAADSLAYQAQSESLANQSQIILVRESCINIAIAGAKTNLTIVINDYSLCLRNTKYDRQLTLN